MSIIRFVFTGDTKELDKAAKSAKQSIKDVSKEMREGVTTSAKYAAATAAAGAAVATYLVKNSIDATRELQNFARVANTSIKTLSQQAYAARSVGVEVDKLSDIYKDTQDRVGDFLNTGGGPMLDFFEKIAPKVGVTAQEFKNLSGPQALQLYVSSLEKANLSQAEMTFYMEAMASDSTMLLPLLRENGKEMGRLAEQSDKLGLTLNDVDAAKLTEAGKVISQVSGVMSGLVTQYSAELAPVITALGKQFIGTAESAGDIDDKVSGAFNTTVDAAGFAMDAVEGIRRTFLLLGQGVATFALVAQKELLEFAGTIVDGPIASLNALSTQLNKLPGVDIEVITRPDFLQGLVESAELAQGAVNEGFAEMQRTLAEPMPSGQFKKFVAEAKEAAQEAAESVVAAQDAVASVAGGGGGPSISAHDSDELKTKLDALRESYATELELLQTKALDEQAILAQSLEAKLISEEEYKARVLEVNQKYQDEATALEERGAAARSRVAEQEHRARMAATSAALGALSTLMNSNSRKMFEVGKAAAISQTVISTYEGAQKAYSALAGIPIVGPALGAAAAGAAIVGGIARVQSIRSQSFGGGGAPATSNTQAVNAASTPVSDGGGGSGAAPGPTYTFVGIDRDKMYNGRDIAAALEDYRDNGGRLALE
jgi:hypothetical protein